MRNFTAEEALELLEEEFEGYSGETAEVKIVFEIDYGCAWAEFDSEYWERPITVCYDPDINNWSVSYWRNENIKAERKITLFTRIHKIIEAAEKRGREIYEEQMTPDISENNREYGGIAVAW